MDPFDQLEAEEFGKLPDRRDFNRKVREVTV
jgi:hypothetical protein